jgi:hypothetical protein
MARPAAISAWRLYHVLILAVTACRRADTHPGHPGDQWSAVEPGGSRVKVSEDPLPPLLCHMRAAECAYARLLCRCVIARRRDDRLDQPLRDGIHGRAHPRGEGMTLRRQSALLEPLLAQEQGRFQQRRSSACTRPRALTQPCSSSSSSSSTGHGSSSEAHNSAHMAANLAKLPAGATQYWLRQEHSRWVAATAGRTLVEAARRARARIEHDAHTARLEQRRRQVRGDRWWA